MSDFTTVKYSRRTPRQNQEPENAIDITEGLHATPIDALSLPALASIEPHAPRADIKNVEYVASYNWLPTEDKIIVPGSPAEWKDVPKPFTVEPDEDRISQPHMYNILVPVVQAVNHIQANTTDTSFDWPSIDFITDRNGLRKLMRWIEADGRASGPNPYAHQYKNGGFRDFRLDLELINEKTVVIHRWDGQPEYTKAEGQKTYGLQFKKVTTQWPEGCEGSTGYHRIIKYDFCGLKLLVRFQVDACLPVHSRSATKETGEGGRNPAGTAVEPVDNHSKDLEDALAGLNIHTSSSENNTTPTPLTIIPGGTKMPQSSMIEITTRNAMRIGTMDWRELFIQLYLSASPHFYLGVHQRGHFTEVYKKNLYEDERFVKERRGAEASLKKLGKALKRIQELVREHGKGKKLSLVCRKADGMEALAVYEQKTEDARVPET